MTDPFASLRSEPRCAHGLQMSHQSGITLQDIQSCESEADEIGLLAFYSPCDCCDTLMHHSACGHGYFVMLDGRTLCLTCASTENLEDFEGATPESIYAA